MAQVETPLQHLTIFLLREKLDAVSSIKSAGRLRQIELGPLSTLFIKRPKAKMPSWARFFVDKVGPEEFGQVKSAAAILLMTVDARQFAIVFGNGRYLLDPLAIEHRFGLLVTLNAVDPKKLRSIDKASLDRQGMQSRTQASRDASASDFGLDFDADLVKAVAGTPVKGRIGETIAGFDSLHVAVRIRFDELRQQLSAYLALSTAITYRKDFSWIDQVSEVRSSADTEDLFRVLIKALRGKHSSQCWMAPDGIIDWNQITWFQFGGAHSAPRHTQLDLERFIEHVGGRKVLKLSDLERGRIRALRADDSIAHEWSALRCLQAEVQWNQKTYLLNAGKWYQIDEEFVAAVNKVVAAIDVCDIGLPEYHDENEGVYNARVAANSNRQFALLDADNIRHGGGLSQIEFCDLYSIQRDIIHVKRYSGSSVLSHLFSQATVSGQSFKSDESFRKKVNAKLPVSHRLPDVKGSPPQGAYRVVIAIVGGPATCVQLPFFSRVTLKNSVRLLEALGYRVAVSHVSVEKQFAVTASLRAKRTLVKRGTRRKGVTLGSHPAGNGI